MAPRGLISPDMRVDFMVLPDTYRPDFSHVAYPKLTQQQECYLQAVKEWLVELRKGYILWLFVGLEDEGEPAAHNPWGTDPDLASCQVHLKDDDFSDCTFKDYLG